MAAMGDPDPMFAPLYHYRRWMGFDHYPCDKCGCTIRQDTLQISFYSKLGEQVEFLRYDMNLHSAAPKEFKNQFLLLHP